MRKLIIFLEIIPAIVYASAKSLFKIMCTAVGWIAGVLLMPVSIVCSIVLLILGFVDSDFVRTAELINELYFGEIDLTQAWTIVKEEILDKEDDKND